MARFELNGWGLDRKVHRAVWSLGVVCNVEVALRGNYCEVLFKLCDEAPQSALHPPQLVVPLTHHLGRVTVASQRECSRPIAPHKAPLKASL